VGNWCRYHVATASDLQDYGKLGNNNAYMIIGSNEFDMTTGTYLDSPIWAWPKPANGTKVTTCPSASGFKFVPSAANEFTPEPANTFGSSPNGFTVAINPDHVHLRQYTLSSASPPVLTDDGDITVPAFSQPAGIPQPGTTDHLDPSDTRLTQANAAVDPSLKAWAVWTQHTVAGSGGGPSVIRWYEIKGGVAQSAPVQTGTISDGTLFAFNGAIAPDGQGSAAAINYDVGNASTDVQVRAQDHLPATAAGSMANETTLATSTGINQDFSCPSQGSGSASCRWGDYAGASTDPTCRANVYGTNEWNGPTSAGVATWASQDFRLSLDECPVASFTDTITGLSVNFDGSASSDTDGSISSYTWSFGDGTTSTGASATTSHVYAAAGTYSVRLTVKDSSGLTASITHKVTVS
jgi:PKD repeat protein